LPVRCHSQPVVAIHRGVGDVPDFTERFDQVISGVVVVLNDE
jgi:hypothetical protein